MAILSAAILTDDKKIAKRLVKKFKHADYIQFDIIDNKFVPGKTLWADDIAKLKVKQPIELHLIINNPEKHLTSLLRCKPSRIIFHIESTKNPLAIIKRLRKENVDIGIAINPETDIKKVIPYLIKADMILVMTVHPSKQNQEFLYSMLAKIKTIRKLSSIDIGVDGGINTKTAKLAVKAGATMLTSGGYLAKSKSPACLIRFFKKL